MGRATIFPFGLTRGYLPLGRYWVLQDGTYIVYDRDPGGILGMARQDNIEELEALMRLVARLGG
jgi:hypothetical protein